MKRYTTFSFTFKPTAQQEEALRRHVGGARFAYNQCLRFVMDGLQAKKTATANVRAKEDSAHRVPWSGFDLINAFNAWKVSSDAGVDGTGRSGLGWRGQVCQQVFEEAAVDLGRALSAWSAGRKGERAGKRPRFPKFKKKATARLSFRLRSKGSGTKASIRLGDSEARSVALPKLGTIAVRECTRKLRRMLNKGRAKILFATVSYRHGGHWRVSLNVEALPLHSARRRAAEKQAHAPTVGIDRGLKTFGVIADEQGHELERIESPRPLRRALPKLRRKSRALSRKKVGSRNRQRARQRLSKTHERIGHVRRDFVHRQSSRLAKTQGHLVIEQLCTSGLMRTRLARSIADSAWALFATMLGYKVSWYGCTLTVADRFYPSTRRCSACGEVVEALPLSQRVFCCSGCGHEADRDTNAAVCLAQYPKVLASGAWPHVAAKHAETLNVCGEDGAGARSPLMVRETERVCASYAGTREVRDEVVPTVFWEAERASARRPRRAVLAETVNTL